MKDMTEEFLADTYAILEIIGGNPRYLHYTRTSLITTEYNIVELYYSLLKDYGLEIAEHYLLTYSPLIHPLSLNVIRKGMHFRLQYKKENLSYVDCIGYALAMELGIKFLTGDQKFKNKVNVEFVK